MMALKLITAPNGEPLGVAEVKDYLRVEHTDDDALIADLIVAARQACENFTRRALITQTWQWIADAFPRKKNVTNEPWWDGVKDGPITLVDEGKNFIEIPEPPLQSVTHLKAYHQDASITTVASSKYLVDTASEPGRLVLNIGEIWPVSLRRANGVELQFVCGYGAAGSSVPDGILRGMRVAIAAWYDARAAGEVPEPAKAAWRPYRIERL